MRSVLVLELLLVQPALERDERLRLPGGAVDLLAALVGDERVVRAVDDVEWDVVHLVRAAERGPEAAGEAGDGPHPRIALPVVEADGERRHRAEREAGDADAPRIDADPVAAEQLVEDEAHVGRLVEHVVEDRLGVRVVREWKGGCRDEEPGAGPGAEQLRELARVAGEAVPEDDQRRRPARGGRKVEGGGELATALPVDERQGSGRHRRTVPPGLVATLRPWPDR
jgi:hypothetical protein